MSTNHSVSKPVIGIALAAIAASLWGTAGTAQSFITPGGLSTLWVGAFRVLFACAFLFPLLAWRQRSWAKSLTEKPAKSYYIKVIVAGLSMAFFNLLFFSGIKEAGVALGSYTTIGSAPLWAGLLEYLLNKKVPSKSWFLGIGIAVSGGALMAISQAQAIEFNIFGLVICLGAGFCYSLYSVTAKTLVKDATPLQASAHIFLIAALIAVPVAWTTSGIPTFYWKDLFIVAYLGLVVTGVAYLLYSTALKMINVSTAVALGLLEPVMAFILAIVVVHEPISVGASLGLVAILFGLLFVLRSESQKNISLTRKQS